MVFIERLKKTIRGEEDDDDDRIILGRYEIGRTLGQGNFGKVKYAKDIQTEHSVALKIIDKTSIKNTQNSDQITREISTLKLLKHPNVVRLHEVLASKTKIYMVLEYVTGGELFDTIASNGKLSEPKARKFFQQLIDGVSYCHKKGVFHRDLKLENVLVDAKGNVKISDFGLSALPQQFRDDGLLHTTCGSPNYVAPEVLSNRGYDGAALDTWSCGVILYVMLTGYLPFDDRNLAVLYQKIFNGDVQMPKWMSLGAKSLIKRILDPNPKTRITMTDIKADEWFKQDYTPSKPTEEEEDEDEDEDEEKNLHIDDEVLSVQEENSTNTKSPTHINAFQLTGMSRCLDLSGFFEKEDVSERKVRFTSTRSQKELLERVHSTVTHMGFGVEKQNQKLKIVQEHKGHGKSGHLSATAEVFEVTTSLYVVEIRKISGETIVYKQLCDKLLKDFGISPNQEHLATSLLEAS